MTTLQAIDGVMMLLDEVGIEYYSPIEVLLSLEQAQLVLARKYITEGRKYFVQPLYVSDALITGAGSAGIDIVAQLNAVPMFLEACKVRYDVLDPAPKYHARYAHPKEFEYYAVSRPGTGHRAGWLAYSYSGDRLYHNGAGTECLLSLYVEPSLPSDTSPILLAEQVHKNVVDLAAQILYTKEVGLPDHAQVGTNAALVDQIQKIKEQQEQGVQQ